MTVEQNLFQKRKVSWSTLSKSINITYHISRSKEKNYLSNSINAEKVFDNLNIH